MGFYGIDEIKEGDYLFLVHTKKGYRPFMRVDKENFDGDEKDMKKAIWDKIESGGSEGDLVGKSVAVLEIKYKEGNKNE